MYKHCLQEKKSIVMQFLDKCNQYAIDKIKVYESQIVECKRLDMKTNILQKKEKWQTYLEFNLHAKKELQSNVIDSWFEV